MSFAPNTYKKPHRFQEYHDHKASGRLVPDGTNVRWLSSRGPLWRLIGRENAWGTWHGNDMNWHSLKDMTWPVGTGMQKKRTDAGDMFFPWWSWCAESLNWKQKWYLFVYFCWLGDLCVKQAMSSQHESQAVFIEPLGSQRYWGWLPPAAEPHSPWWISSQIPACMVFAIQNHQTNRFYHRKAEGLTLKHVKTGFRGIVSVGSRVFAHLFAWDYSLGSRRCSTYNCRTNWSRTWNSCAWNEWKRELKICRAWICFFVLSSSLLVY